MALDGDWKDDLDVTRVIQAPVVTNFVTQPDIPLESFNPLAYKRPSEHREPKVTFIILGNLCETKIDRYFFFFSA